MGEWSPENVGGRWIEGEPGCVGAAFVGRNRSGDAEWEAAVTVTEADAPRRFSFVVGKEEGASTRWRYEIEADGDGSRVTEAFEWEWLPSQSGFRAAVGELPIGEAKRAVAAREQALLAGAQATLSALKRALEERSA